MDANTMHTTTAVLPPTDFPVAWPDPQAAAGYWTRDREHMPDPVTPMFFTVAGAMAIESRNRVTHIYDEAVVQRRDILLNTYIYTCITPFSGTAEELTARARRNREKISAISARLEQAWREEWQPELEAHWAFWRTFDLRNAPLPTLLAHLNESIARGSRLYEIHYLMGSPMWFAIDEFETFYGDLFPGQTRLDAHRLLQGFDNKTLEIGRALWRLRDLALQTPEVAELLAARPSGSLWGALEAFAAGRAFLTEVRAFLEAYGGRSNLWDWGYPSWQDDPTPVFNNLKAYLAQPDRDLRAELAAAAAARESAVAEARRALATYPRPIVRRFEQLLRSAQLALVLTENHTYYIDFNGFGWIHRVVREFGNRFAAAGRLEQPDDVFYLKLDELRALATDAALDYRARAVERRAEVERWATYDEPRELGVRPTEPLYLYSPDARRMLRYVGGYAAGGDAEQPLSQAESDILVGQVGAAGKVRGRARVILSLNDAHRLQPGEILVTTTTSPPWTPLFLTAAAVVTDMGGLLSHGAVVAREYRIPAVVGTRSATQTIRDGQWLEVDGNRGRVRLLADED